jgi:2-polyprenyl-6-hydroxyphenyl methylase/3-demethylubiquinone-9 3-methyltransferase
MEGISYEYSSADHEYSHPLLFTSVSALLKDIPEGASVLDMGCGNGTFLSLFQNRGWKLYGADLSPTGIQIAQQTFPQINFFLADVSAPTTEAFQGLGPFDVILSTEVIEHLYNPRGLLRNAFRLLKPGGVLIVTTPYHGYLKNLLLALTGRLDSYFNVLWDHGHIKFWSRKTLSTVLIEAGFKDLQFYGCGRISYIWNSMIFKATKP